MGTSMICLGVPCLPKMEDTLLTVFHATLGAVVGILIVPIFLTSIELWNGGVGILDSYFNQHIPQFDLVENTFIGVVFKTCTRLNRMSVLFPSIF